MDVPQATTRIQAVCWGDLSYPDDLKDDPPAMTPIRGASTGGLLMAELNGASTDESRVDRQATIPILVGWKGASRVDLLRDATWS